MGLGLGGVPVGAGPTAFDVALALLKTSAPVFGAVMPVDGLTDLIITGGKVQTISDQWGDGSHPLTQGTSGKRAEIDASDLLGSRPGLRLLPASFIEYDSASGGPTGTGDWTMIMAAKVLAAAPATFATGPVVGDTTPGEGSWLGVFGSTITSGRMLAIDISSAASFDDKYHIFTTINRAGLRLLILDGGWVAQTDASQTLAGTGKFGIGIPYIVGGSCFNGRLVAVAFYARDLGADRIEVENALCTLLELGASDESASPRLTSDPILVCDGDSRTRGFGSSDPPATSWPILLGASLGIDVINSGADGAVIDSGNHLAAVDAYSGANRRRNLLVGGYGYNDASEYTLAQRKTKFIAYIAARRAAGFVGSTGRIAWWTVPGNYTGINNVLAASIASWNSWLLDPTAGPSGGGGQYVDLVMDAASIPELQTTTNPTYYFEAPGGTGIHFTDAANILLAAFFDAALSAEPGVL